MTHYYLSWAAFLVCLVGFLEWGSNAILIINFLLRKENMPIGKRNVLKAMRLAPSLMLSVMAFSLGYMSNDIVHFKSGDTFKAGYQQRDLELLNNMHTLAGVVIDKQLSKSTYVLHDKYQRTYKAVFCDNFKPQFPEGLKLHEITYEARDDRSCWNVATSSNKLGYYINAEDTEYARR